MQLIHTAHDVFRSRYHPEVHSVHVISEANEMMPGKYVNLHSKESRVQSFDTDQIEARRTYGHKEAQATTQVLHRTNGTMQWQSDSTVSTLHQSLICLVCSGPLWSALVTSKIQSSSHFIINKSIHSCVGYHCRCAL